MKIGFEAKRVTHNATGLGNYGRFVVDGLASIFNRSQFHLYSINRGNPDFYKQLNNRHNIYFHYPQSVAGRIFPSLWRSNNFRDLCRDGIEIFHGLSGELPKSLRQNNIRSAVTIHDLIFLRYPQMYKPFDRCIYERKYRDACRRADVIVAVSQHTKEDIMEFFGISGDKIKVVYQGCHLRFNCSATAELKNRVLGEYGIKRPYILYTGSIEERKNLLTLVKAYDRFRRGDFNLVAVGRETPYLKEVESYINRNSLAGRVRILTSMPNRYMPALYQMAHLFVYPSRYEGFGIPVLEALASKAPVIAATGSCLEETGGKACLYFDPDNVEQLAEMLDKVLMSSTLSERMVEAGRLHLENFTIEKLSMQMMDVYKGLV